MADKSNLKDTLNKFLTFFKPGEVDVVNDKFVDFVDVPSDNPDVEVYSVIDTAMEEEQYKNMGYDSSNSYKNLVYGKIPYDKPKRVRYYRTMSFFPEVGMAIDEICDGTINYDENGRIININTKDDNLTDDQNDALTKEFEEFVSIYDLENEGWEYFRDIVIDGEVCFENLMDKDKPELGIVGVKRIPTESFEYLIDVNMNIVGILVNAQLIYAKHADINQIDVKNSINSVNGLQNVDLRNQFGQRGKSSIIPFPINQITLANTGQYSIDKTIVYPVLELARRAYRQLSLIEDAIIIYRLIRAPERLVFNVDTGGLPPAKAEEMVLKLMKRYQTKKVYDPTSGTVVNDYDPHQMLESYWFPKIEGSAGTTVNSLQSGQSLGNLEDLNYFLKKLYNSLKIPYNRFSDTPIPVEKSDTISYEEYRFSKFINRLQDQFAKGIFSSFVTHLKLNGIWEKFKLNKRSFTINFVRPTSFDLFEQQRLLNLRMDNFNRATEHEMFSKDQAAKKYLGMSDGDLEANYKALEAEMIRVAYLNRKVDSVAEYGTPYGSDIQAVVSGGEDEGFEGDDIGGDIGGDVGGAEPEVSAEPVNAETPETTPETAPEPEGEF